ncbi:hypothetical protein DLH72_02000 [Candidatus Gracilibacteria bacterium]|nr:MAG: hypothetical protein DLH72_02000 [Candidatus Gracilibacteria bacterium]
MEKMEKGNFIILRKDVFIKIFFIIFTLWFLAVIMSYFLIGNMISGKNNFFIENKQEIRQININI